MNFRSKYIKGSLFCPFFVLLTLASCQEPQWENLQGEALGTTYSIQYFDDGDKTFTQNDMDSIMLWINHALSTYQDNSMMAAFNNNDRSIWNDPENLKFFSSDLNHFMIMVQLSDMVNKTTYRAFDPTAAKLFQLYAEAKSQGRFIDQDSIDAALQHIGFDKLGRDDKGMPYKIDEKMQLNFNAIAKGYAVDEVAVFLESLGVSNYMVEIGGEVKAKGLNPTGELWLLGVNKPEINANSTDIFEAVELKDRAMATSGNYRNYYQLNDSIIGHTIDPRTGHPVQNTLKSATVFHKYCAIADAFATACMVLGPDSAEMIIAGDTTLTAYFIVQEGDSLRGYFVK